MEVKYAVLEDAGVSTRLVMIGSDRKLYAEYLPGTFEHISSLWNACQRFKVTHVWCMPGSTPDRRGWAFFHPIEDEFNIFSPLSNAHPRPDFPRGGRCWREGSSGHQIIAMFPHREPWSLPIENHSEPLAMTDYLSRVLSVPVQWSPQSMGIALLEQQYSKTTRLRSYLRKPTTDLTKLPFKLADRDVSWAARVSDNIIGLYLHVVDKRSNHPAAASYMECGIGEPHHHTGETDGKLPGVYRVTWRSGKSVYDGSRFPMIIESNEWVTQPILNFARLKGYEVKVHEAWIFQEHARLFGEWARDLWQARLALKQEHLFPFEPGREFAGDIVKAIMNHTISALNVHWWSQMVGNSRAGILANVWKFAQDGYYPLFIYRDSIGYASNSPLPPTFLDPNKLGGYRAIYKQPIYLTSELVDQLKEIAGPNKGDAFIKVLHQAARLAGVR